MGNLKAFALLDAKPNLDCISSLYPIVLVGYGSGPTEYRAENLLTGEVGEYLGPPEEAAREALRMCEAYRASLRARGGQRALLLDQLDAAEMALEEADRIAVRARSELGLG